MGPRAKTRKRPHRLIPEHHPNIICGRFACFLYFTDESLLCSRFAQTFSLGGPKLKLNGELRAKSKHLLYYIVKMKNSTKYVYVV